MNKTAKGNAYENNAMPLVRKLIADGTLAIGKHYCVRQHATYETDFGTDKFVADISVEVKNPHFNDEISYLIIFECKDLETKLDKSDLEEWRGKISNMPYGVKLYFVTRTGYSKPIIRKAMWAGIGLIIWDGEGEEIWVAK